MKGFQGKKAIWVVVCDPVHLGCCDRELKEVAQGVAAAARTAVTEKLNRMVSPQPSCYGRHGVADCDKLEVVERVL